MICGLSGSCIEAHPQSLHAGAAQQEITFLALRRSKNLVVYHQNDSKWLLGRIHHFQKHPLQSLHAHFLGKETNKS
jgi:hypothetical protein